MTARFRASLFWSSPSSPLWNRLIENCGINAYEELFDDIIIIAMEKGVNFGRLQVVDSVNTVANVNLIKDGEAQREADNR